MKIQLSLKESSSLSEPAMPGIIIQSYSQTSDDKSTPSAGEASKDKRASEEPEALLPVQ